MVPRLKFRRFLFLASLIVSTIVVFEVLVFPVIRHVDPGLSRGGRAPSNLAKPNTKALVTQNLEEKLLKQLKRSAEFEYSDEANGVLEQGVSEYDALEDGVSEHSVLEDGVLEHSVLEDGVSQKQVAVEKMMEPKKYWFFKGGTVWPTSQKASDKDGGKRRIYLRESADHDRIIEQLMYVPSDYDPSAVKTVVLTNKLGAWNVPMGPDVFQECPVKACTLSSDINRAEKADVVMFRDYVNLRDMKKSSKQIWIIYILESPAHTNLRNSDGVNISRLIDWTATYRVDSDIVAPYEKWVYYDEKVKTLEKNRLVNFAFGKTHKVAWFVSNCGAANERLEYARELQKYISVDIYGSCGNHSCPRGSDSCKDLLNTKYKFYLSFENSNCKDYITEKYFVNGLGHNVLPIVMGAEKAHYLRSSPLHSFIHVDDFESPKQLAEYLHQLDNDDTLYNEYFQWKGSGEFINTYFWCRLCTMIHDAGSGISGKYSDLQQWWHGNSCRKTSWRIPYSRSNA